MVLSIIPSFSNMIEYSAMKNSIIPRIKNLCLHTTSLTVRVTLSDVVIPFSELSKIICFPVWLLMLCLKLIQRPKNPSFFPCSLWYETSPRGGDNHSHGEKMWEGESSHVQYCQHDTRGKILFTICTSGQVVATRHTELSSGKCISLVD